MENKKYLNIILIVILIILITEIIILGLIWNNKTEAVIFENEESIISLFKSEVKEAFSANSANYIQKGSIDEIQEEPKEFYIKVNYQENVVNIYIKDLEGNFTKPYKAMVCSTGVSTPKSGVYKMSDRGKWGMMVGRVWAQYYSRINGAILFHSVPYTAKNPASLEYWEYDKLGTTASAGCVRLTVEDAKWIYENCKAGTQVEFYADTNPGPLGKPTATKIAETDENMRNWDPTDPNPNNPWNNY